MRISAIFLPFFAVVAGAAGFYIRRLELFSIFNDFTGLPLRGAGITTVLIAVSAAFFLIALVFAIRVAVKHKAEPGFENSFDTDHAAYPVVLSVIGAVWLGVTVKRFIDLLSLEQYPVIELLFLIMSALAAISVAFLAIEMFQDPRRKLVVVLSVVPTLFMCFWLIMMYRENATNPILISYAYHCLAIITATLGFYFTSGFAYNKPAPGKAVFFYLAAIYFCFVTLADDHAVTDKIIFIAIIAINTVYVSMLIRNLKWKES